MALFDSLRSLFNEQRVQCGDRRNPVELVETAKTSTCQPITVCCESDFFAVRLKDNDHRFSFLRALPGVFSLPDYFVIADVAAKVKERTGAELWLTICELKSSIIGREKALGQLRFGRLLADYLVRLAWLSEGGAYGALPVVSTAGILVVKGPGPFVKGGTAVRKVAPAHGLDGPSGMEIHHVDGGDLMHLARLF